MTIEGRATQWTGLGDSGQPCTFNFCPVCGSTVYWELEGFAAVAVGLFADPGFPPPHISVYEERQHQWALAAGPLPLEHQFQDPGQLGPRHRSDVRLRRIVLENAAAMPVRDLRYRRRAG